MMVLPLGITFTAILMAVSAETRTKIMMGVFLSFLIVVMDCIFFFAKNSFIAYNCDGGLLLSFASLFFFAIIGFIRFDDRAAKVGNIFLAFFMLSGFMGIAYWDRPTFIPTSDYSAAEIAAMNAQYQDYIASFQNGEGGKWQEAPKKAGVQNPGATAPGSQSRMSDAAKGRLDKYVDECTKVIARMKSIIAAMESFGTLPANISEAEREQKSQQALAINNNATALNKKTLGLFHPHESSEAHSEIIQASESIRLAAYSLYTYTLQENVEEQANQYRQCRNQIAQAKNYLDRFWIDIENLKSNYQPQQEE